MQDGITYWFGVVASDDWGNSNVNSVLVVEATPMASENGSSRAPDRVEGLMAWDHPDDDGTKIDIVWNRSTAPDFDFYTVWVSEYPLSDVTEMSERCETGVISCSNIVIDQRQIGGLLQLQMTVDRAMYGATLETLVTSSIYPDVPLYVAVTVHLSLIHI